MRIALFYFVLFTSVGIILPYLPPYFRSLGFSGKEIALAVSLQPLLMIVVPPLWGYLADRTSRPVLLLRIATAGAALAFVPMNLPNTMSVDQAVEGVAEMAPRMVIPYHHRGQDPAEFAEKLTATGAATETVILDWYPGTDDPKGPAD